MKWEKFCEDNIPTGTKVLFTLVGSEDVYYGHYEAPTIIENLVFNGTFYNYSNTRSYDEDCIEFYCIVKHPHDSTTTKD